MSLFFIFRYIRNIDNLVTGAGFYNFRGKHYAIRFLVAVAFMVTFLLEDNSTDDGSSPQVIKKKAISFTKKKKKKPLHIFLLVDV